MQSSVFLTPIFAKQIGVGFGVCEELAVFSPLKATLKPLSSSPVSSSATTHPDHLRVSMADMPQMNSMQHINAAPLSVAVLNHALPHTSHQVTPTQLTSQVEPNHQHHAQCEFCLLLGHSVLPPLHVVIAILLTLVIAKMMVKAKTTDALFLNQNKNLRPQGRAPPLFIS